MIPTWLNLHYLLRVTSKLILFSLLIFLSCDEDDKKAGPANETPSVSAENLQSVSGSVQGGLNFDGLRIESVFHSAEIKNGSFALEAPKGQSSQLAIFDESGEKLLAIVDVDSLSPKADISVASITKAIVDLAPSYNLLTGEQRLDFHQKIESQDVYSRFTTAVAKIVAAKESLLDANNKSFISVIAEIDNYIQTKYLTPESSPGRVKSDAVFSEWIGNDIEGMATLTNPRYSYADVKFIRSGSTTPFKTFELEPKAYERENVSVTSLTGPTAALTDDCYSVVITQSSSKSQINNGARLATTIYFVFMGKVMSEEYLKASTPVGRCVLEAQKTAIISIQQKVVDFVMAKPENKTLPNVVNAGLEFTADVVNSLKNEDCFEAAFGAGILFKLVSGRVKMFLELKSTLQTIADVRHSIVGLVDPVEGTEEFQIYKGSIMKGCMEVSKGTELVTKTTPGKVLSPEIKVLPKPFDENLLKAGFDVSWKLAPGHGSVNLLDSKTNSSGSATTQWTLPSTNGRVTLTAEVKDREGHHLPGSPVTFNVDVEGKLPTPETMSANKITDVSAIVGGAVSDEGSSPVTDRGICFGTQPAPTVARGVRVDGTIGSFEAKLTGLTGDTKYYARAYAKSTVGIAYGNEISFTTLKTIDSTSIYKAQIVGRWSVNNLESGSTYIVELTADGKGTYFAGNATYPCSWEVRRQGDHYYYWEYGFWHLGYNQFRVVGVDQPNEHLTNPVSVIRMYGDFRQGAGINKSLVYIKN